MGLAPDPRLSELLSGAKRIADPDDPLGRRARAELARTSALSEAGIELAFRRSWEADTDPRALEPLSARLPPAPAAHVLLSANVFSAALRAIVLALLQTPRVFVRASSRAPTMARLLAEASPGVFTLVPELTPRAGDHVWAYGRDATLAALRSTLPDGVVLHAHGSGFGIAVIDGDGRAALAQAAAALADDVIVFDQRGCLSPRVALVQGGPPALQAFATSLAERLAELGRRVPPGSLDPDEAAAVTRFRDTALYAGDVLEAGPGLVSVGERAVLLPPIGRNVHVHPARDLPGLVSEFGPLVTAVGVTPGAPIAELARRLPGARIGPLGAMQSPPLDGPVDRRADPRGELIRRG